MSSPASVSSNQQDEAEGDHNNNQQSMMMSAAEQDVTDMIAATKQSLAVLRVQKQSLESEAEAIISELTTPPAPDIAPMGIDTPLVDNEGYPRNDIDVMRARTLRHRLAQLRTDRQQMAEQSEQYLHQLARLQNPIQIVAQKKEFAARVAPKPKPKYDPSTGKWVVKNWDGTISGSGSAVSDARSFDHVGVEPSTEEGGRVTTTSNDMDAGETDAAASIAAQATGRIRDYTRLRPFARVNSVAEQSPASQAGLQIDDLVVQFGTVAIDDTNNKDNDDDVVDPLQAIGKLVPNLAAQQQTVEVVVRRTTPSPSSSPGDSATTHVQLTLSPRPWPGRGLLGCHIVPYQA